MEILIAMAVGMIALVVVAQTFAVTEGQRRTTTSGSDAQQTAMVSLSLLEGSLLNAGMNLTGTYDPYLYKMVADTTAGTMAFEGSPPTKPNYLLGCSAMYGTVGPITMAPVLIEDGASGAASDEMTIIAGNNAMAGGGAPVPAAQSMPSATKQFLLSNGVGYAVNDWIVIAEQNGIPANSNLLPKPCTLARIVALPDIATSPTPIVEIDVATSAAYENAWIFNLGPNPVMSRYRLENSRLVVDDLLNRRATAVVAEGVVNMQAQYGFDVNNDDQIDQWLEPTFAPKAPLNSAAALQVSYPVVLPVLGDQTVNQAKAVRIGITLRSNELQKPNSAGDCTTSAASLGAVLAEETSAVVGVPSKPSSGAISLTGADRCYRYYSHATIIPLYNVLWSDL
jgi:type IV pilus assembly protein PilW